MCEWHNLNNYLHSPPNIHRKLAWYLENKWMFFGRNQFSFIFLHWWNLSLLCYETKYKLHCVSPPNPMITKCSISDSFIYEAWAYITGLTWLNRMNYHNGVMIIKFAWNFNKLMWLLYNHNLDMNENEF